MLPFPQPPLTLTENITEALTQRVKERDDHLAIRAEDGDINYQQLHNWGDILPTSLAMVNQTNQESWLFLQTREFIPLQAYSVGYLLANAYCPSTRSSQRNVCVPSSKMLIARPS